MPQPFLHFGDVAFMGEGENGPVTHALQHDCSAALYVGDDVTDEDVFALRDARILTVRIGKKKGSSARYFLKRQAELAEVLRLLVEAGDQSIHTWGGCHEQGAAQPLQ
jgi:trehalose 6-phosphate phosphatase